MMCHRSALIGFAALVAAFGAVGRPAAEQRAASSEDRNVPSEIGELRGEIGKLNEKLTEKLTEIRVLSAATEARLNTVLGVVAAVGGVALAGLVGAFAVWRQIGELKEAVRYLENALQEVRGEIRAIRSLLDRLIEELPRRG